MNRWRNHHFSFLSQGQMLVLGVLFLLNLTGWIYPFRWDATRDKRYTPSAFFLQQVQQLETPLRVRIYLDGDLPPIWMALKSASRDFFTQYALAGGKQIDIEWEHLDEMDENARQNVLNEIQAKGGRPLWIRKQTKDGSLKQEVVCPCALVSYQDKEMVLNFLEEGQLNLTEKDLAPTLQRYDFLLSDAILALTTDRRKQVAFWVGNGCLAPEQTRDIADYLNQYYRVSYVSPKDQVGEWDQYAVVIIAKPDAAFSEKQKYTLDQYLMQGGSLAFFVDGVQLQEDRLAEGKDAVVMGLDVGLQDLLFHYGLRIQSNLLQDNQCAFIPVQSMRVQNGTQFEPAPWPYFPLFQGQDGNSVSTGLFSVLGRYVSGIDTLALPGVKKHILMKTSPNASAIGLPGLMNLSEIEHAFETERKDQFITAVLCEGSLGSAFRHRAIDAITDDPGNRLMQSSKKVRYALVSDGDLIRNEVSAGVPLPLGYDRFIKKNLYSNRTFAANLVHYLAGDEAWLNLRNRKWEQALLDKQKVREDYLNGVVWLVSGILVWILGIYFAVLGYRKHKYGKKWKE